MAKVGAISVTLSAHTMAFTRALTAAQQPLSRVAVAIHRTQKVMRAFSSGAIALAGKAIRGFAYHFPRTASVVGTFVGVMERATAPLRRFARSGVEAAQEALARLNRRFPQTAQALSRLGGRATYAGHRFRQFAVAAGNMAVRALQMLAQAARRASNSMVRLGGRALTGIMRALTRLRVLAIGAIGAITGLASVGMVFARSLKLWADFEQATVSLTTFFNSAEKAKDMLKDLVRFAAVTPFRFPEVLQAARSLAAFGLEREGILPTLRAIGDVAAGVNADIRELAEAYGKVIARNQMMARNLIQFTLRGIPMVRELNKVLGTTGAELRRRMEEGKVSAAHMAQAFANMTSEGGQFFDLMKKQSTTLGGFFSNLMDQIDIFLGLGEKSFGAQFAEAFKLKAVMADIMMRLHTQGAAIAQEWVDKLLQVFKAFTDIIAGLGPLLGGVFDMAITFITALLEVLTQIAQPLQKIADILGRTLGAVSEGGWLAKLIGKTTPFGWIYHKFTGKWFGEVADEADKARTPMEAFTAAAEGLRAKLSALGSEGNRLWKWFSDLPDPEERAAELLEANTENLAAYLEKQKEAGLVINRADVERVFEMVGTLYQELDEFGKSKYDLMLDEIGRIVKGTADDLGVLAEAQELVNKLMSKTEAAGIVADLARWQEKQLTPMDRYNRDVATYKRLLDEGTLSVKDWSAAMDMAYANAQEEQAKLNKSVADMSVQLAPAIMAGTAEAYRAQYKARMQNDDQHRISLNVAKLVKIGNDQLRAQQDTTRALQSNQVEVWGIDGP